MKLKRLLYLGYYYKNLDKAKFDVFIRHAQKQTGKSRLGLTKDMLASSLKYNISLLEYFQFGFYNIGEAERQNYAGTGYMYEFQRVMNPVSKRDILDDKKLFYQKYNSFFQHKVASLDELKANSAKSSEILNNPAAKVVFKVSDGKCGAQVVIKPSADFSTDTIVAFMEAGGFDMVEQYIIQHPDIMALSPSAVNTVRIFTQLTPTDEVVLLGCRLRISVNSPVDNMAAGNLAAPIDDVTGIITGPGVYSDITKPDEPIHPVTGVPIVGFQIPFWNETLSMITRAAKEHKQNRSIGWDIVITENGPGLIEGNHDWCKLVWQLPVRKGLKEKLEIYL